MTVNWRKTLRVWYFGLTKIPMILFVRPRVSVLNADRCVIGISLRRRTQNHLKSLYFGTLAVGADLAGGLLAMEKIASTPHRISLVFKDVQANFLKRVDGDAVFSCVGGAKIATLIDEVVTTGERQQVTLTITVSSPERYGDEVLAEFALTLSLKLKS